MPYCPECGAEVSEGHNYCGECGAQLHSENETETHDETDSGKVSEPQTGERQKNDGVKTGEDYENEGLVSFAISYPGRSGIGPLIVGALLLLLSILILPFFVVVGYFVKIAEHAAKGELKPPEDYGGWSDLLVYGLVVVFLIFLPFNILIYAGLLVPTYILSDISPLLGVVIGSAIMLLLVYVFPAVLVNYSVDQKLKHAYDPDRIISFAFNSTYLVSYIINLLLGLFLGLFIFAAAFLSLLTIVGWIIVIPLLYFYLYAVNSAFWGRVYYKLNQSEPPT